MTRLVRQHALVTGGGTGIGAAIARALAAEGAVLTLVGRRREPLDAMAAELPGAAIATANVGDMAQVEAAFAAASARHGPVSILVNNAGLAASNQFSCVSPEEWRAAMATNLDGVYNCCSAAIGAMRAAGHGRIVTIASTAGLQGFSYTAPYVAAKHGAVGLMRALAAEYAGRGITANAICPGFADTEIVAEAARTIRAKTGRSEGEARAELAAMNPSGRLIAPAEIAASVVELILSERTGEAVEIS